eukprot:TRINITY_DN11048_c0_g1_i1.p1 TRINITY_DN11048_c0_g1~~TRINITY_DN11048_c0_g1_i1.p1  ORF type:complete len:562 (+),score=149.78 TRINITY_DN11048_c0_g1_i1:56-1741(+)
MATSVPQDRSEARRRRRNGLRASLHVQHSFFSGKPGGEDGEEEENEQPEKVTLPIVKEEAEPRPKQQQPVPVECACGHIFRATEFYCRVCTARRPSKGKSARGGPGRESAGAYGRENSGGYSRDKYPSSSFVSTPGSPSKRRSSGGTPASLGSTSMPLGRLGGAPSAKETARVALSYEGAARASAQLLRQRASMRHQMKRSDLDLLAFGRRRSSTNSKLSPAEAKYLAAEAAASLDLAKRLSEQRRSSGQMERSYNNGDEEASLGSDSDEDSSGSSQAEELQCPCGRVFGEGDVFCKQCLTRRSEAEAGIALAVMSGPLIEVPVKTGKRGGGLQDVVIKEDEPLTEDTSVAPLAGESPTRLHTAPAFAEEADEVDADEHSIWSATTEGSPLHDRNPARRATAPAAVFDMAFFDDDDEAEEAVPAGVVAVERFLQSHCLGRYASSMADAGYDDLSILEEVDDEEANDLAKKLGMPMGHQNQFRRALKRLRACPGAWIADYADDTTDWYEETTPSCVSSSPTKSPSRPTFLKDLMEEDFEAGDGGAEEGVEEPAAENTVQAKA